MSNLPGNPNGIPNKAVDLLVSEILRKNGVNVDQAKRKISDEQKMALKELVEELSMQVDAFVNQSSNSKNDKK
nr:spore coat protein [Lysinibacillus timonensis]